MVNAIKVGRDVYDVTEKDYIYFNGSCYTCMTFEKFDGWKNVHPTMGRTQANKLIKKGVLYLANKKQVGVKKDNTPIYHDIYKFDLNKMEALV